MNLARTNQEAAQLFGFGRLFELTYEAVVGADLVSETIVLWNPAAERMFGYLASEAIGLPLETLVAPELRDAHHAGLHRFRETGVAVLVGQPPVEVPALTKDGRRLTVALSLTDIPTRQGDPHVVAVIRDVTAEKQAELELVRANETMRDFVATASHDLRTPLTTVLGFALLLQDHSLALSPSKSMEFAAHITRAAEQANQLVDNLLTVSKIQADLMESFPRACNLATTLAQCTEDLGTDVETDMARDLDAFVDYGHLVRMLCNLISNAAKYGRPPIVVSAAASDGVVKVAVRDFGDGVPEEFRDRLFDRFSRASNVGEKEGTGLGLSILQGLARANGGDAFYEPLADGSVFGVALPAV